MNQEVHDEAELRRYLLGELKLDERVMVEQRLFLDDEYLHLAQALQDDLIDEYSDQEMTSQQRERFESYFLSSPERRQDLRITRAIKRVASETTKATSAILDNHTYATTVERETFLASIFTRRPVAGFAFVAILIVLSVIAWRVYQYRRLDQGHAPVLTQEGGGSTNDQRRDENRLDPSNQSVVDQNQEHKDERAGSAPSPTSSDETPMSLVAAVIMPGPVVRGDSRPLPLIDVPSGKGFVSLTLPLEDVRDYSSYSATLRRDGRTIRSWTRLKSQGHRELGKIVVVEIPTTLLSSSLYEASVRGRAADGKESHVGSYAFEVHKQ